MKFLPALLAAILCAATTFAQAPENSPAPSQMDALTTKIDEINGKLDALSQQLLKIEQQMTKPGVMVGEATPAPSAMPVASAEPAHPGGNTHVVARGETLTSIAKQYKVGVEELQKFNHIEDGRKLQAGQTVMIPPPAPSASPSTSPSPSPAE
ncbi:MAG: LysM peptidoglycan-binding domain-containing protein [Verrucomicrobia bacterium]|nr:LysM peptidoglycan-binding domain-containing protein [Verrucomicrobiota bacterium]